MRNILVIGSGKSASYLIKKEYQETVDSEVEEQTETDYFPKWKGNASLSWSYEDFRASIAYYYTGEAKGVDLFEYTDVNGDDVESMETDPLDPYQTITLTLSSSAP